MASSLGGVGGGWRHFTAGLCCLQLV